MNTFRVTLGGFNSMGKKVPLHFRSDKRSETILNYGQSRVTLVSLDAGEAVDTHRATVPATAIVVEGEITLTAEGGDFNLKPGEVMLLDANEPHSLKAIEKSTVIVTRLADTTKESRQTSNSKGPETKITDQAPECNH